jgi:cytochrome b561
LYFIAELPPVVAPDKVLAKQTMAAHEFVGYILLALIALHAAAALFHHFVLGDNVLRAMLPRPARRPGAADAMRLAPQGEDF